MITVETRFSSVPGGRRPHRHSVIVLFTLVAALAGGACSLPEDTAAVVNGRPVAAADLNDAFEDFLEQYSEMAPPVGEEAAAAKKMLVDRLIDAELMRQEMERRGIVVAGELLAGEVRRIQGDLRDREFEAVLSEAGLSLQEWKDTVRLDLAMEMLQREVVVEAVDVTEEEVDGYLREHRIDREIPEEIRASQILVRTREEALEAAKRIRGGEDFAAVAREISLSPDAEQGGDLGYFSRGQMPQEFEAVVFSLDPGKLSSVVETTYGHHLFLVSDRRETRLLTDGELRGRARAAVSAVKSDRLFQAWISGLREKADIRYNKNILSD